MSIPSLDEYLTNFRPHGSYFGENTLFGVYRFMGHFSDSIPQLYAPYDFICFNDTCGNVYTAIRRYHEDYGYKGLYIIVFIISFIYRLVFNYCQYKYNFILLLYAMYCFPFVELSIEERFFMSIFSPSTIFVVVLTYIMFKLLITYDNVQRKL